MFKLLNKEDNQYEYLVYNLDTEYLNGIRRVLYSKLKSYCFDINSTVITKNNTNINNEIITHRLSLIPLNLNKVLKFSLSEKNTSDEIKNVYSNSLKCSDENIKIDNKILLVKLKPGEEINLVTNTIESNGENNTSFRPFSICFFKIMKFIYIKKNVDYKNINFNFTLYNKNLDLFEQKDNYNLVGYTNEIRDYCDPLKNILSKDDYIIKEIKFNNNYVYYFTIEMFYENNNIINNSLNLLLDDLDNFKLLDKKLIDKNKDKTIIKIINGNYHILNILSKYLRNYMNIYSVYNKEHPLKNEIILEYKNTENIETYDIFLNNIIEKIKEKIKLIIFD